MPTTCGHKDQMNPGVSPTSEGCEEGLKTGEKWVELRTCQTCGHVGCCDSSPGKHAREHFKATEHPLIKPHADPDKWTWCYIDDSYL